MIDWAAIREEALGDFTIAALPPTVSLPALPLAVTQFVQKAAAAAVALAGLLPDQLRQCYEGLEQLLSLEQKWPEFNLQRLAETVDARQAESGLGVRNDFPLSRRCKLVANQKANNADGSVAGFLRNP